VGYGWLGVVVGRDGKTSVTTSGHREVIQNKRELCRPVTLNEYHSSSLSSLLKREVLSRNWRVYFENIL